MKKVGVIRFLVVVGVALILLSLIYFSFVTMMPDLIPVLRSGEEAEIEAYLRHSSSTAGMVCTGLLQFVQVLSIVLPGAPIQIAAGIVYGATRGLLICYTSYVVVNLLVFLIARHLGARLDRLLPPQEGWLAKKMRLLCDSEMPVYMTAMATLIPLVPNGIIPYAAAKTDMRFSQFCLAVALGAIMPITVMCTIGSRILAGDYLLAVMVFAISLAIVALLTRFRIGILRAFKQIASHLTSILVSLLGGHL